MNNVQIQGRIPFDITFFPGEGDKNAFASFTVAVNTGVKNEDGYWKEDLFRCKAFGYAAEHLNSYFNTRDIVTFDGKLTIGPDWTDKEGNLQKGGVEILVSRVYGFGSKTKDNTTNTKTTKTTPSKPSTPAKPSAPSKPSAPKRPSAPKPPKATA